MNIIEICTLFYCNVELGYVWSMRSRFLAESGPQLPIYNRTTNTLSVELNLLNYFMSPGPQVRVVLDSFIVSASENQLIRITEPEHVLIFLYIFLNWYLKNFLSTAETTDFQYINKIILSTYIMNRRNNAIVLLSF